jgi:hypothetical protein
MATMAAGRTGIRLARSPVPGAFGPTCGSFALFDFCIIIPLVVEMTTAEPLRRTDYVLERARVQGWPPGSARVSLSRLQIRRRDQIGWRGGKSGHKEIAPAN